MLFSCKITHSVITYLDRRGENLEAFYETCDWPAEFLRDPSSWLEAEKIEKLLGQFDDIYSDAADGGQGLIVSVGHGCKELRAWGVLDSVLRMVQTPKDLFSQPERFLSYFVSPAPPVGAIRRDQDRVSFVLPISAMQFPRVTSYLRAALEALPTYLSKPMANVLWDDSLVTIVWAEKQESLFAEGETRDLSFSPELARSVLHDLEASQKELEEAKRSLIEKENLIRELRASSAAPSGPAPEKIDRLKRLEHDLYRLGDYVARGHQLITLLIGQGRQTPQVREAMRRVDWEVVALEGPQVVKNAVSEVRELTGGTR